MNGRLQIWEAFRRTPHGHDSRTAGSPSPMSQKNRKEEFNPAIHAADYVPGIPWPPFRGATRQPPQPLGSSLADKPVSSADPQLGTSTTAPLLLLLSPFRRWGAHAMGMTVAMSRVHGKDGPSGQPPRMCGGGGRGSRPSQGATCKSQGLSRKIFGSWLFIAIQIRGVFLNYRSNMRIIGSRRFQSGGSL